MSRNLVEEAKLIGELLDKTMEPVPSIRQFVRAARGDSASKSTGLINYNGYPNPKNPIEHTRIPCVYVK